MNSQVILKRLQDIGRLNAFIDKHIPGGVFDHEYVINDFGKVIAALGKFKPDYQWASLRNSSKMAIYFEHENDLVRFKLLV